jgi:hypothetical protein
MKKATTKRPKTSAKTPRGRTGAKPGADLIIQATTDEFEREGLGVAPKV